MQIKTQEVLQSQHQCVKSQSAGSLGRDHRYKTSDDNLLVGQSFLLFSLVGNSPHSKLQGSSE